MAKKGKLSKDKERTGRQTPRDVEIQGTFAEAPKPPKEPPREATAEEERANNIAMYEFCRQLGRVDLAVPQFKYELEEMNRGKRGRPFEFPDSMVLWIMSMMAVFDMTFRSAAGFASGLLEGYGMAAPSTSRLLERANMLVTGIVLTEESRLKAGIIDGVLLLQVSDNVVDRERRVGLDSSGFITVQQSLWRSVKWKTKKVTHWLKAHVLSDLDSGEVIAYAVTLDSIGDPPMMVPLVKAAMEKGHKLKAIYGDGAYSSDKIWKYISQETDAKFITSFKKNTVPRNNGCQARGDASRLWCITPYHEWKKITGYGFRWKSECGFSDIKRTHGEEVKARTIYGQSREMFFKMRSFDLYKRKRAEIMKVTGNGVAIA